MTGNRKKNSKGSRGDGGGRGREHKPSRSDGRGHAAGGGPRGDAGRNTEGPNRGRSGGFSGQNRGGSARGGRPPAEGGGSGGDRPPVRRNAPRSLGMGSAERRGPHPAPPLRDRPSISHSAGFPRPERAAPREPHGERRGLNSAEFPPAETVETDGAYLDPSPEEAPELGLGSVPAGVRYDPEIERPSSRPPSPVRDPQAERDLEAQIRSLEARLDGLIQRSTRHAEDEAVPPMAESGVHDDSDEASQQDSVSETYIARNWGREALRSRLEDVDDFGLDPAYDERVRPGLDLLYRRYFRVQCQGIDRVPSQGRAVIVANHSGMLPMDGLMLRAALRLDHPNARALRWLAEDFVFYLPFAGVFLNRIGAVRACPENAERLLEQDALVAVFPEGVQGIKKLFAERYQLQRFGRGGYIRLCLRMRAPLVPCAIIGAEEANPLLYRFDWLAQMLKLPFLPVTPTFPWLGPLGLLPAPTRWKLRFGEPISFDNYGPEAANDDVLVGRLSERVRAAIQSLLDSGLRERKSVWFG